MVPCVATFNLIMASETVYQRKFSFSQNKFRPSYLTGKTLFYLATVNAAFSTSKTQISMVNVDPVGFCVLV